MGAGRHTAGGAMKYFISGGRKDKSEMSFILCVTELNLFFVFSCDIHVKSQKKFYNLFAFIFLEINYI